MLCVAREELVWFRWMNKWRCMRMMHEKLSLVYLGGSVLEYIHQFQVLIGLLSNKLDFMTGTLKMG